MLSSSAASRKIAKKKGKYDVLVDLKLDARLKPSSVAGFEKCTSTLKLPSERLANLLIPDKTYAIGSGKSNFQRRSWFFGKSNDKVYYPGDFGLFGCVFEAWKNHWILRTSPEDWWFPIARRIAKAVDEAAKPNRASSQKVRHLFASHQGKENIAIDLPCYTIYDADYDFLFKAFAYEIGKKIKVPEFAKEMQNDFGTSGAEHKIASQMNLIGSLQEFFTYEMRCLGCGLRGLEMSGSVADWESLSTKLERVRQILKPIQTEIRLGPNFWKTVSDVFANLANTRKNPNDPEVAKFWINILMDTTGTAYVGGGGSMPGEPMEVKAYNGWLIPFLTNEQKILAKDLENGGSKDVKEQLSGWNQVPMKVSLPWCGISDTSTLVAGMAGFMLHKGESEDADAHLIEEGNKMSPQAEVVPSLEPNHMWAMMFSPNSKVLQLTPAVAQRMLKGEEGK